MEDKRWICDGRGGGGTLICMWSQSCDTDEAGPFSLKHNNKEVHPPIREYVHPQTHDCLISLLFLIPCHFTNPSKMKTTSSM